jgi:hypothetical protein
MAGTAVTAAVLVALVVAARLLVPAEAVRSLVAARLGEALGRPVSVGEAKGGILPRPWIELRDLAAAEGPDGVALAVDAVRLRLRWGPLLHREVQVDRAELAAPTVTVRLQDPAAAVDSGAAAGPPGAAAPAALPVTLTIEHFIISGGRVHVMRADGAPVLELGGLGEDLALQATPAGDVIVLGTTTVDSLRLHLPAGVLGGGLSATWRKDLRWDGAAGRLRVITSELALGDLAVAVSGAVDSLLTGRPVADLRLQGGPARLASLQGFLPAGLVPQLDEIRSEGTASVEAEVRGPLTAGPEALDWNLRFALTGGRIEHPQLADPVTDLAVVVQARPGLLTVAECGLRSGASRAALRGAVSDPLRDPAYDLDLTLDVDLAQAAALAPPDPAAPRVSGRADLRLRARGRAADPASLVLSGPIALSGVAITGPAGSLPVTGLGGKARLDGNTLVIDDLAFSQGRSDYHIRGTVTDPLALAPAPPPGTPAVAAARLVLSSALLDVDEILAAGRAAKASARAAARSGGGGTEAKPAEPPAAVTMLQKLTGRADITVGTLRVRGQSLTEVQGTAAVDRGRITIERSSARIHGGTGAMSGVIDLADAAAGRVDLDLAVTDVRAEQFFASATTAGRLTRLAAALKGGLTLQTSFAATLDDTFGVDLATLSAGGQAQVRGAQLSGLPLQASLASLLEAPALERLAISDLRQPFRVADGKLSVEKMTIKAGEVTIAASGWQAIDGRLSARMDLTLPPDYAQGLRRQLPAQMADLLLDAEGKALVLPVSVGGRVDDPQVQLDTDKLAQAAAARAEARLARETDRLKQQALEEANRTLQDLLKVPADTAAAAGDSAAAPSLRDIGRSLLDRLKKKGGGGAP